MFCQVAVYPYSKVTLGLNCRDVGKSTSLAMDLNIGPLAKGQVGA